MMGNTVFYHANCMDGLGAAWVIRQMLQEEKKATPLDRYVAANYGQRIPWDKVDGQNVYIVDFSFDVETLKNIILRAVRVIMLDHHPRTEKIAKRIRAWLQEENIKTAQIIFRSDQSGALMTWNYCFPDQQAPSIIEHISDRDLWDFKLDDTQAITDALATYPKDLGVWSKLFKEHDDGFRVAEFLKVPQALPEVATRIANNEINWTIHATMRMVDVDWVTRSEKGSQQHSERVPVINCPPHIASASLARLAASHPFAMSYFDTRTHRIFSLRSSGFNVREVAEYFRGGGHDQASGFKVPRTHHLAQI